jgi:NADPH-dependent F420 reductase
MTHLTIAVIGGTGAEGSGLAQRWAAAGYTVIIGSRMAEKGETVAAELAASLPWDSATLTGTDNGSAAEQADVVVFSVPYSAQAATLEQIKDHCDGKVLISVVVPLKPPKVAVVWQPEAGSAAKEIQNFLGESVRVTTAFQNISAFHAQELEAEVDCDVLVTGDDKEAKAITLQLVEAAGFAAVDAGPLANASVVEGMTSLLIGINMRNKIKNSGIRITGIARG